MSSEKICLTGCTGGLGSRILHHLLFTLSIAPSRLIISTPNPSSASSLPHANELDVRKGDFLEPATLSSAFAGATRLLLVSYPSIAHGTRVTAHQNAIDAAVRVGIKYILYTSLAFAGDSEAAVMRAHIDTEAYLKKTCARAGVKYTIVREGIYSESYPLYLGFFDAGKMVGEGGGTGNNKRVVKIAEGADRGIAWVDRDALGEGTAKLLVNEKGEFDDRTVLLSGSRGVSLREVAELINGILGWEGEGALRVEEVGMEAYVDFQTEMKTGNKEDRETREFMELWASTFPAIRKGELDVIDPLLEILLGRELKPMKKSLEVLLKDVTSAEGSIGQYAK